MSTSDEKREPIDATEPAGDRESATQAQARTTEQQEADADRFNEIAQRDGATPAAAEASSLPRDADESGSGE